LTGEGWGGGERKTDMESAWSKWKPIEEALTGDVPEKAGVYQIRCVDKTGKPVAINRLARKDKEGIVGIGESGNLKTRLGQFNKTIIKKDYTRHAAAWHYLSFRYDKIFPVKLLQVRYKTTRNKSTATKIEFELLLKYRKIYMDSPPLNNSRGKFPYDYSSRIKKLFKPIPGWEI
jgi:hypothetical protein